MGKQNPSANADLSSVVGLSLLSHVRMESRFVVPALPDQAGSVRLGDRLEEILGDRIGDRIGDTLGDRLGDRLGDKLGDRIGDRLGDRLEDSLGESRLGDGLGGNFAVVGWRYW